MADFYQILGIDRSADSSHLRAAYHRMALLYHPDRNPHNKEAEEMFKAVNEAYHVLSDPLKRARYDANQYGYASHADSTEAYWREVKRQQYMRWKARQQEPRYRFDREYFRIQGLAFLTFLVIASFCFGLIHTVNYIYALRRAEVDKQNRSLLMEVNALFDSGQIDDAFRMVNRLREENPVEYRFYRAHDSLLSVIRNNADREFTANHFSESRHFLEILKRQESPARLETLRKLAICEYQTGDFRDALQSLKQIFNQQPWNLDLLYQIGIINLVNLQDYEQAHYYLTLGKKIFKENMTRIYGSAFEIVMIPDDAPDVYHAIFEARARTNLELQNYAEAETDCNWAIFLKAKNPDAYLLRVQAKVSQQKSWGVCKDLAMAKSLGAQGTETLERRYCR
jgi:tetratricopeptide (TPR) repeat protein